MVSIPTSLSTNKTENSIISQNHVNDLQTGVRNLADEFNVGVTSRLKTFTSTPTMSSLRIPSSQDATTANLESGDIWNQAGVLKFYDGTATRNIVLSSVASPLAATTLSASGTTTLDGAANFNQPTTVTSSSATAFRVKTASSDFFTVNTDASTVNVAGTLQISGASLLSPEKIHTAGFTFNIGNGQDALSAGPHLPVVVIPYACDILSWRICFPDRTYNSISLELQRSTWDADPFVVIGTFGAFSPTPIVISTTGNMAREQTLANPVALSENMVLRLNQTGTTEAKIAAIHIRVRKK